MGYLVIARIGKGLGGGELVGWLPIVEFSDS